ncbi:FecR domain-containing protein [Chitinophaga sp. MM2321]|uniref:FecR family protein n=1 Tax=Chitinophaga sp. MM2321 TaxID=3137178 RepID=UPI0032D5B047
MEGVRFQALLKEYISGDISPAQHHELFTLIDSGLYNELLEENIAGMLQREQLVGADLAPHRAQRIVTNILSAERHTDKVFRLSKRRRSFSRWIAAAAVFTVIATAAYLLLNRPATPAHITYTAAVTDQLSTENTSVQPQRVQLEDGTAIVLQPGARITYARHFLGAKREVYLSGEAFFEISNSAHTPFLVYSNSIVTQVLGTSFSVLQNKLHNQVEVNVRTGKVQVFENPALLPAGESAAKGIILTPNQKGIYKNDKREFETTLVEAPEPLTADRHATAITPPAFVFEGKPIADVLSALEKAYGIEIVVENDNLYHCIFTGDVTEQSLYTKLDMITRVINATYEIKGTRILIKGSGCK